jgi:hypothetical protein
MKSTTLFPIIGVLLLGSVNSFQRIHHSHSVVVPRSTKKQQPFSSSPSKQSFSSSPSLCFQQQHPRTTTTSLSTNNDIFGISDLVKSKRNNFKESSLPQMIQFEAKSLWNSVRDTSSNVASTLKDIWWITPMTLAIIPLHSVLILQTCAQMPSWWKCVPLAHLQEAANGGLVVAGFLLSNIAYFLSGFTLMQRFPFRPNLMPTRYTMLGVWIALAGLVSTVFHSVQALGSHHVAESLCYVDHGVALSAGCYYLNTLGFPSKRVWTLGIIGLILLGITHVGLYSYTHSVWHLFSAAAATLWGLEGPAVTRRVPAAKTSLSQRAVRLANKLFPATATASSSSKKKDHAMHRSDALGILYQSV